MRIPNAELKFMSLFAACLDVSSRALSEDLATGKSKRRLL
jgi:hypothetical protein